MLSDLFLGLVSGIRKPRYLGSHEPSLIRACLCLMGSYEICKTTACSYLKKNCTLILQQNFFFSSRFDTRIEWY